MPDNPAHCGDTELSSWVNYNETKDPLQDSDDPADQAIVAERFALRGRALAALHERMVLTQREALTSGRLGDFNEALLRAALSGDVWDLVAAYGRADERNQQLLENAFPELPHIANTVYNRWPNRHGWLASLQRQFPRLRDLDGPVRFTDET